MTSGETNESVLLGRYFHQGKPRKPIRAEARDESRKRSRHVSLIMRDKNRFTVLAADSKPRHLDLRNEIDAYWLNNHCTLTYLAPT